MTGLRVRAKQCKTCIYHPSGPGRPDWDLPELERQIADPRMKGYFRWHRVCHSPPEGEGAEDVCCRGFWEKHKDHFTAGQLAQRLNFIEFVRETTPEERSIAMSNRSRVKRAQREERKKGLSTARPAYHFHSRYAGMTPEQIERQVETDAAVQRANSRLEPKRQTQLALPARAPIAPAAAPLKPFAKGATNVVELGDNPVGEVQEGTLRAAVVEALSAGRGRMTVAELSALLEQDARPVVAKLAQKGWLRRV